MVNRTGTTGSRSSRKSDSVIDVEDNDVVLRSKPAPGRSLSTVSNGTTVNSEIEPLEGEQIPVRRAPRTKEEIELSNLKKKTRKRTRRFEVDGVVVTTTTNKVCIFSYYLPSTLFAILCFNITPCLLNALSLSLQLTP